MIMRPQEVNRETQQDIFFQLSPRPLTALTDWLNTKHHGYRTHFEEHPRIEHARPSQLTTQKLKGAFSEDGSLHKSVSQISEKTAQKFALRTIPNEFKDVPKAQDLA